MVVNRLRSFQLLLCFGALSVCAGLRVTVLAPINDGEEIGVITVPGAYIAGDAYESLGRAMQESSSHKMWVALTGGFDNELANPRQIGQAIELAVGEMKNAGMTTDTIVLAGHSLGAAMLTFHVALNPDSCVGLIFFGAVPTFPDDDLNSFPVPFIHVSGDIDAVSRITSLANHYTKLQNSSVDAVKLTHAFTVLQGINHGIFATGPMPPNVVNNDVDAEVSESEAHGMIGDVVNLFIVVTTKTPSSEVAAAEMNLIELIDNTTDGFIPLIEARDLESFSNYSTWSIYAQEWIAGTPRETEILLEIVNFIETNDTSFGASKPSVVRINNDTTLAYTTARLVPPDDSLQARQSCKSLDTKMKGQEAIRRVLGDGNYGEEYTCKQINEEALQWALSKASSVARHRYESRGQKMVFGDDVVLVTGAGWLNTDIIYENTTTGEFQVTSIALVTPVNFPTESLAGVIYCKLMSPYRAIEWIYTDCLRAADPYIIDEPTTKSPATTEKYVGAATIASFHPLLVVCALLSTLLVGKSRE
ncbi:uncharacterized protein [Ptychodera flava]|uniref:uncharacterized protein n=1 Tax=Ptychodera flava TaxID=63121 RepID=UPI00396A5C29